MTGDKEIFVSAWVASADTSLWANSTCAACNEPSCYGTCPDYNQFENEFLRAKACDNHVIKGPDGFAAQQIMGNIKGDLDAAGIPDDAEGKVRPRVLGLIAKYQEMQKRPGKPDARETLEEINDLLPSSIPQLAWETEGRYYRELTEAERVKELVDWATKVQKLVEELF